MENKSTLFTTRNFSSKNKVFAVIDECRKVNNCLTTIKTETIDNHFHHDFHIPEENIYRPIHQMGFVHSTQIQNKSHPHPHLSLLQDLLLFGVAAICPWWASKASSSKRSRSRHNHIRINDAINRNMNESNNHVSTVSKTDIIILLPYLGLT